MKGEKSCYVRRIKVHEGREVVLWDGFVLTAREKLTRGIGVNASDCPRTDTALSLSHSKLADATALRLIQSLVRSRLNCVCSVYGSAHQSFLKRLDPIHRHDQRLALGAFRTSDQSRIVWKYMNHLCIPVVLDYL